MENKEKIRYFLYARKSSEGEDRQIQSINDQINHLKELSKRLDIEVVEIFEESKSAKKPYSRPVFDKMIERVENGEASGILCWHINRLTRNPIDSGKLSWLLQKGIIQSIQSIDRKYAPEDNVILFSVETGAANQFIIDLRKNSMRGTNSKAEKGWLPSRAPLGYLNEGINKGEKTIACDENRFDLVRKMWDMVLDGERVSKVLNTANKEWGLTTPRLRQSGGKELSKSFIYRMFSNLFYTGKFKYRGKIYQGKHKAMVTMEEFEKVQKLLNRKDSPRPYKQDFAYTGIIKCGCGCENSITGERKIKKLKSTGEQREYLFYRSTRRKKIKRCTEKPVTEKDLEDQVLSKLENVEIHQDLLNIAFNIIDRNAEKEISNRNKIIETNTRSIKERESELKNLIQMRMKDFIDDTEFIESKEKLEKKILVLKENKNYEDDILNKKELLKNSLSIISKAKEKLEGSTDTNRKKKILSYFGRNHTLLNKEFTLETEDWLTPVLTDYKKIESEFNRLELPESLTGQRKNEHLELACPGWGAYS